MLALDRVTKVSQVAVTGSNTKVGNHPEVFLLSYGERIVLQLAKTQYSGADDEGNDAKQEDTSAPIASLPWPRHVAEESNDYRNDADNLEQVSQNRNEH